LRVLVAYPATMHSEVPMSMPLRLLAFLALAWVLSVRTVSAQIDLTGMWAPIFHEDQVERVPGPEVGDFTGLPINDALRMRADTWDAGLLTLPEHQCKPHPSTYGFRGVGNLRISADIDDATQRIVKLNTHIQWQEQKREIWMDGRPHPPAYAPHTWQGFSTGRWDGNVLEVRTTHLKAGWVRRNGTVISDRTTMTERFIRHGNVLTHVYIIEDPVYLAEPLVRTNGFQATANPVMQPYPCYPTTEVDREKGEIPHHLPGSNPFLEEYAKKHNLPLAGVRGGAATALPEFMKSPPAGAVSVPPRAVPPLVVVPDGEVRSMHVQGNVWMLASAAGNAAVQIGDDGVLVVDTMTDGLAEKMIEEIRKLAGNKPIRWIVNTHAHPEHSGGNAKVAEAGESIIAGNFAGQAGQAAANYAQIFAHENAAIRLARGDGKRPPPPAFAQPSDTFYTSEFDFHFNGEAIQLIHVPNAHSDGDVMVFFRKSDVLVAGDLFLTTTFPTIDSELGGHVNGVIAGLNRILDITVPKEKQEGGTYVIPGSGRLSDEADVVEYRDMVTIIRDRIRDSIEKKRTLEQVKAARLAQDYEGRWAPTRAAADAFVEAVHRGLSATPAVTRR
jgi:glyoxylase-like metal-dependent hydrolase (beta-lactamase superfamily II)